MFQAELESLDSSYHKSLDDKSQNFALLVSQRYISTLIYMHTYSSLVFSLHQMIPPVDGPRIDKFQLRFNFKAHTR